MTARLRTRVDREYFGGRDFLEISFGRFKTKLTQQSVFTQVVMKSEQVREIIALFYLAERRRVLFSNLEMLKSITPKELKILKTRLLEKIEVGV